MKKFCCSNIFFDLNTYVDQKYEDFEEKCKKMEDEISKLKNKSLELNGGNNELDVEEKINKESQNFAYEEKFKNVEEYFRKKSEDIDNNWWKPKCYNFEDYKE